jgi:hypothetical protein
LSKKGTSKLAASGRRALVALGLKRRPTGVPFVAAIVGLSLAAGAVLALFPRARKALSRQTIRAKRPLVEASFGSGVSANGVSTAGEPARRAVEGLETDELGRAENEGMNPGRW